MLRRPPRSTLTDELFPYTKLVQSGRRKAVNLPRCGIRGKSAPPAGSAHHPTPKNPRIFLYLGDRIQKAARPWIYASSAFRAFSTATTSSAGCGKGRSEEHTSALQSLMRISYAVLCFKQTKNT